MIKCRRIVDLQSHALFGHLMGGQLHYSIGPSSNDSLYPEFVQGWPNIIAILIFADAVNEEFVAVNALNEG